MASWTPRESMSAHIERRPWTALASSAWWNKHLDVSDWFVVIFWDDCRYARADVQADLFLREWRRCKPRTGGEQNASSKWRSGFSTWRTVLPTITSFVMSTRWSLSSSALTRLAMRVFWNLSLYQKQSIIDWTRVSQKHKKVDTFIHRNRTRVVHSIFGDVRWGFEDAVRFVVVLVGPFQPLIPTGSATAQHPFPTSSSLSPLS